MARSLVLLFLAFFAFFSAYADVFLSIDCGASDSYTDENSIVWMGDDTLIQNGKSQVVQTTSGVSHVMTTLRVFRSRKKNCYSVEVDKGGQVLVRASFFYGNYDKKSAPPTFDLHFDGNYWVTVQTSLDQLVSYEVAYVVKGDYVSVCLAQTHPNQFPFISALEVRSLGSNTYGKVDSNYALHLTSRVAYGAKGIIRYINGYDLSGTLPDFSSMDALETIDLHNNSVEGPIPDFLGTMPNLKELNLANNAFSGPIPASISKNNKLKLMVSGNPDLCVSGKSCQTTSTAGTDGTSLATPSGRSKKSSKLPVILGSTIPTFLVFWAIVGVLTVLHQKRKRAAIAAATTGHAGGAYGPNGTQPQAQGAQNNSIMEKIGEALVNEIKVTIQDEITSEISDQLNPQAQQQQGN
ncbi:hypothetical protein GH714_013440 [Hevea brasiliensis]|uniref:Malectin-like domain-containing protein n=1 Tax=Hevea brasiliensis TaxID=3981 RepID=A0A6A6LLF3_HEVBR|nr:hypothetical protein GH714_013440 [Hevea brasiliensis]